MNLTEELKHLKATQAVLIKRIARLETESKANKPKRKRKSTYVPKLKWTKMPTKQEIHERIDRKFAKKKAA